MKIQSAASISGAQATVCAQDWRLKWGLVSGLRAQPAVATTPSEKDRVSSELKAAVHACCRICRTACWERGNPHISIDKRHRSLRCFSKWNEMVGSSFLLYDLYLSHALLHR